MRDRCNKPLKDPTIYIHAYMQQVHLADGLTKVMLISIFSKLITRKENVDNINKGSGIL
jgi:hypothetical protein